MERILRGLIRWLCLGAVSVTRVIVPARSATCRFCPSCSAYALEAIDRLPLHTAVVRIVWRLCRCHPFSRGGYDPVVD